MENSQEEDACQVQAEIGGIWGICQIGNDESSDESGWKVKMRKGNRSSQKAGKISLGGHRVRRYEGHVYGEL